MEVARHCQQFAQYVVSALIHKVFIIYLFSQTHYHPVLALQSRSKHARIPHVVLESHIGSSFLLARSQTRRSIKNSVNSVHLRIDLSNYGLITEIYGVLTTNKPGSVFEQIGPFWRGFWHFQHLGGGEGVLSLVSVHGAQPGRGGLGNAKVNQNRSNIKKTPYFMMDR